MPFHGRILGTSFNVPIVGAVGLGGLAVASVLVYFFFLRPKKRSTTTTFG